MFKKIKIWQVVLILTTLLFLLRFEFTLDLFALLVKLIMEIFIADNDISLLLTFNLIDHLLSAIILVLLIILIIFSQKIKQLFSQKISLTSFSLLLLLFSFVFAPIITKQNPDFQKDISVTKLLPPFSSVNYFELIEPNNSANQVESFKAEIDKVIPKSFTNSKIFFDSYKISEKLFFNQGALKNEIELNKIKTQDGRPVIKSKLFLLGSDEFGRDVFTRIVYGSRISIFVGLGAVIVAFLIGITFSFIAAEKGGLINTVLSRVTDLFLSFPSIFLVILVLALFGNNLLSIIIVLGFSGWMSLFKVAKSEILSIKNKEYYLSAKLLGLKKQKLLINEILPVIIVPVLVNLVFQFSNIILAESALSFLGLGTGNNYPSWGAMIESGQRYISQSWWLIFIPGIVLIMTLLSINELGRKINKNINPAFD